MATKLTTNLTPGDLTLNTSDSRYSLGFLASSDDGRRFRYVKAGAVALVPGKLYQSPAETTAWEALAITTASGVAGSTALVTTSTITATKDQLAGGFVSVTTTPGLGYTYKIKGNTAATAAACTIYLEDPVQVAITSSSAIDVIANPFAEVLLSVGSGSGSTGMPVGVAVYPVTAEYYGWVQVGGPCTVLADGGLTVGALCVSSNATAGALEIATNASTEAQPAIGVAITGISTGEYGLVNLNLN